MFCKHNTITGVTLGKVYRFVLKSLSKIIAFDIEEVKGLQKDSVTHLTMVMVCVK